jgi:hypothetical protein
VIVKGVHGVSTLVKFINSHFISSELSFGLFKSFIVCAIHNVHFALGGRKYFLSYGSPSIS